MSTVYEQFTNGADISDLFDAADVVETSGGLDLDIFKDEKLDSLEGVPFLVMGGTFREAYNQQGNLSDFVTLTCIIADEKTLEARRIRVTGKELWFPGSTIGINDGSTGIRRQIVSYLYNCGAIMPVESGSVIKEEGPRGECTWDRLVSEWEFAGTADHNVSDEEGEKDRREKKLHKKSGKELTLWDFQLPKGLLAPRGIRISRYPGPFRKEITTRYLG